VDVALRLETDSRRWWALGAVTLAVLAVGLDGTVLSVALPTLAGSLQASESDLQWFGSGYLLVLAAAMLPVGVLGDRFGRKRVMVAALTQAFTHGLDEALVISADIALAGAVLALLFLPRTNGGKATEQKSNTMEELAVTS
jgi:DHA2 family multidrug resistance protein-like MFS transporter